MHRSACRSARRAPCPRPLALSAAVLLAASAPASASETGGYFELSLEQLMQESITSASRVEEALGDAPATVIVLTADDLRRRGYRDLSAIYDDLPGMDLSRPYGDTYFRNQWRGLRKTIGTPYLLMLDGVIFNHLYFNQDEVIATFPLANIERIEIVYGPASAVYGANAFVGVINVITRRSLAEDGLQATVNLQAGSFEARIADFSVAWQRGDWRAFASGRFDHGNLDPSTAGDYQWTRAQYLQDRSLWGAWIDDRSRAGRYDSPRDNVAFDGRIYHGDTEFALQYFSLNTHFGTVYPGDRVQMRSYWAEPDLSVHLRHAQAYSDALRGTTLIRYRESGLADDSDTLEAYEVTDPATGLPMRVVNYSYWGSDNRSWSLYQDFEYALAERWTLAAGIKHERKDLQKAYRINYGPDVRPEDLIDIDQYPIPGRPHDSPIPRNRIDTDDSALYALARYRADGWFGGADEHHFNAGVRFDHNSEYGTARTLRGGYVFRQGRWTAKLLYGESFNEPAPRELYGGWRGSGSDPRLDPETAATTEASIGYTAPSLSGWISAYSLRSDDNIVTFSGGARNLGQRDIEGVDAHVTWRPFSGDEDTVQVWGYYSWIDARETRPQPDGTLVGGTVGDTAERKLYAGATWLVSERLSATLRGRHIGARRTVPTNPVGEVDAYTTFDLNLLLEDVRPGIDVALAIYNLTDRTYFHPGLREGNAGFAPGYRDADGRWIGSGGYYNSLLPQDGRGFMATVTFEF